VASRRPGHRATDGDARVCVAQIGAPHGVRGEVHLRAFTEDAMSVARYGPLEAEDRSRSFEIAALRPGRNGLVARLAGIDDRDAAARLTNVALYVPRSRLPAIADQDTYYHVDLIGLAAVGPDGTPLGTVCAIHQFGAGDLLEMEPEAGRKSGPTIVVPFTRAAVPVVDVAAGKVVVDMSMLADPDAAGRLQQALPEPSPRRRR